MSGGRDEWRLRPRVLQTRRMHNILDLRERERGGQTELNKREGADHGNMIVAWDPVSPSRNLFQFGDNLWTPRKESHSTSFVNGATTCWYSLHILPTLLATCRGNLAYLQIRVVGARCAKLTQCARVRACILLVAVSLILINSADLSCPASQGIR